MIAWATPIVVGAKIHAHARANTQGTQQPPNSVNVAGDGSIAKAGPVSSAQLGRGRLALPRRLL